MRCKDLLGGGVGRDGQDGSAPVSADHGICRREFSHLSWGSTVRLMTKHLYN